MSGRECRLSAGAAAIPRAACRCQWQDFMKQSFIELFGFLSGGCPGA